MSNTRERVSMSFVRETLGLGDTVTLHQAADLLATAAMMIGALKLLDCPDCGHPIGAHADKYGCEIEKGDQYRSINGQHEIEQAMGPCSCTCEGHPDLQRAIDVIRKATGRAI